jgi:hypothetical protein
MKIKFFLIISLFAGGIISAQDSVKVEKIKSKIISFTPKSKMENTTGINFGVMDDYKTQKINGINLQGNPLSVIYLLLPHAVEVPDDEAATVSINGLHISTGGMTDAKKLNGLGISMYHITQVTNGFTVNGFNNNSGKLNGLHVSFLNNSAREGHGLLISFSNTADTFGGAQIGIYNNTQVMKGFQGGAINISKQNKGVQIGLVNKTDENKGLQIGFWNKNSKRTLPLINF